MRRFILGLAAVTAMAAVGISMPLGASGVTQSAAVQLSPSQSPCDGEVGMTLSGFQASKPVKIELLQAHSDGPAAELGTVTADASGNATYTVRLGPAGCDVAALDHRIDQPGDPATLILVFNRDPDGLANEASAAYVYTTTQPGVNPSPTVATLPVSGGALEDESSDSSDASRNTAIGMTLAVGLVLIAGAALIVVRSHRGR